MRELAIRFGKITEQSYDKPIKNLDKTSLKHVDDLVKFLTNLRDNEYWLLKKIYQMPPKTNCWDQYRLMSINGLREQVLMDAAGNQFREAWKKRPIHVRKKPESDSNETSSN